MGKHTNSRAVDRCGLLKRYAALRDISKEAAERMTRDWTRSELRDVVESIENGEKGAREYRGTHARFLRGRTTSLSGYTSTVQGFTR